MFRYAGAGRKRVTAPASVRVYGTASFAPEPVIALPLPLPPLPPPASAIAPTKCIILACAAHYGIKPLDIISVRRTADVVLPRQVGMYLTRECTKRSWHEIGKSFGGRDHTTILYGWRKISRLIESDEGLRADIEAIRQAAGVERTANPAATAEKAP